MYDDERLPWFLFQIFPPWDQGLFWRSEGAVYLLWRRAAGYSTAEGPHHDTPVPQPAALWRLQGVPRHVSHWQTPGHQIRPENLTSIDYIFVISSPNPMFNHLLESSHRDDSNKCSNIGFGEEITKIGSIEDNLTGLIWYPALITSQFMR